MNYNDMLPNVFFKIKNFLDDRLTWIIAHCARGVIGVVLIQGKEKATRERTLIGKMSTTCCKGMIMIAWL